MQTVIEHAQRLGFDQTRFRTLLQTNINSWVAGREERSPEDLVRKLRTLFQIKATDRKGVSMVDVFHGSAQIPGASEPWDIELSVDWQMKEVYLRIPQAPSGMTDWSATMVQVIANQELVFRTKGLPGAIAHWWHMFRNRTGGLSGLVLSLPDDEGNWMQCTIIMDRGELPDTQ